MKEDGCYAKLVCVINAQDRDILKTSLTSGMRTLAESRDYTEGLLSFYKTWKLETATKAGKSHSAL